MQHDTSSTGKMLRLMCAPLRDGIVGVLAPDVRASRSPIKAVISLSGHPGTVHPRSK